MNIEYSILVPIGMGLNPVYAVAVGVAVGGFGILPGFVAGYVCYFLIKKIDEILPPGVDVIVATLLSAVIARELAILVDPGITVLIAIDEQLAEDEMEELRAQKKNQQMKIFKKKDSQ